jgi:hypothetical protein
MLAGILSRGAAVPLRRGRAPGGEAADQGLVHAQTRMAGRFAQIATERKIVIIPGYL